MCVQSEYRKCKRCYCNKDISLYTHKKDTNKLTVVCRPCIEAATRYRVANPEKQYIMNKNASSKGYNNYLYFKKRILDGKTYEGSLDNIYIQRKPELIELCMKLGEQKKVADEVKKAEKEKQKEHKALVRKQLRESNKVRVKVPKIKLDQLERDSEMLKQMISVYQTQ